MTPLEIWLALNLCGALDLIFWQTMLVVFTTGLQATLAPCRVPK